MADATARPAIITIRQAAEADAAVLAEQRVALFTELGQHPAAGQPSGFEQESAAAFHRGLRSGTCLAWLASVGAGPVGSVALLVYPRLPSPSSFAVQEGYLLNVYTDPRWRGIGVATALVATAVKQARLLGLARIRLHASAQGRPVYATAGFASRDDEMELRLD